MNGLGLTIISQPSKNLKEPGMNTLFNKEAAILLGLLIVDMAYIAWAVHYMNHQQGWDGFLAFVYLLPPGAVAGFAILAKLIAHLWGKSLNWTKALGVGMLGLVAGFAVLVAYTVLNN